MERMGSGAAATVTLAARLDTNVVTWVTFVEHGTPGRSTICHIRILVKLVGQGQQELLLLTGTLVANGQCKLYTIQCTSG